jgi:hypothetical protein
MIALVGQISVRVEHFDVFQKMTGWLSPVQMRIPIGMFGIQMCMIAG